jgi:hypothetical protein
METPLTNRSERPFYESSLSWKDIWPFIGLPIWILILIRIVSPKTVNDFEMRDDLPSIFMWYLIFILFTVIFGLRKFKLYDDRIEIVYPLRVRPFFLTNKKEFNYNNVRKISLNSKGGKASKKEIRFKVFETQKNREWVYLCQVFWFKDLMFIYNKYKEIGVKIEVNGDRLKEDMGID